MRVIDADGHVNECPATFDDKYLDPAFRDRRPAIVGSGGMYYWMIGEQVFPRRSGLGCNNFSTPARIDGKPTKHGALIEGRNLDTLDSQELTDLNARIEALDAEDIDVQVIYPTLFLAYPLTTEAPLMTALCSSYNRWMGDTLAGNERLKWAGVVNLEDVPAAVQGVLRGQEPRGLGHHGAGNRRRPHARQTHVPAVLRGHGRDGPDPGSARGLVLPVAQQSLQRALSPPGSPRSPCRC